MTSIDLTLDSEYRAAHQGAVMFDSSRSGLLRLTGETRIDLVDRLSTNEITTLQTGQGAATILTTHQARIIDRVIVYIRDQDLLLLTSPGAKQVVVDWFKSNIFFNDDVQVYDLSEEQDIFSLYGTQAGDVLSKLVDTDVLGMQLHEWGQTSDDLIYTRTDPIAGNGFHLLAEADLLSTYRQAAIGAGAILIGEQTMELLRIESGLPGYETELSNDYIPLEVGLWEDVSFSKGCYLGQEIIARMESRQKLAKKMVGLRASAPLEIGGKITVNGSSIGKVTSAVVDPNGKGLGLGFVKPDYALDGTKVNIGTDSLIDAVVIII